MSRVLTFCLLMALVGMLPFLSGKDPAAAVLRARSAEQVMTQESLAAIRRDLGLGESASQTLLVWLRGLARADLGDSWVSGAAVGPSVAHALGVSLSLMACALAVAFVVAAALCVRPVLSGLHGRPRAGSGLWSAALTAIPEFLLASVLLIVLSVWLGWLPPFGWSSPVNIVLPALALGIPAGGLLGRLTTEALVHACREPWVLTCRLSGWNRSELLRALARRALPSVLPQVGLIVVGLTGGAVAVEQIFTVPGIGRTALGAAASSDLPMLQASVMVLLLVGVSAGAGSRILSRLLLGSAVDARALHSSTRTIAPSGTWWIVPAACACVLLVMTVAGLGFDPYSATHERLAAPGHSSGTSLAIIGADASGRDVLARLAHRAIMTMSLALGCALLSWVIGMLIGLSGVYAQGPLEAANAMPPVLSGMIVATIVGPSAWGAALAVLLVSWAPLAAHAAALREEAHANAYAQMAPLLGISQLRFTLRTVVPSMSGTVFRHAMLRVPGLALAIASLGFLGLGPQPPRPDWGLMLADGITYFERAPWVALAPMAALITLSVLAVSASSRKV